MKILHICITSNVFNKDYAYQDNLLTKYHSRLGHEVSIITSIYSGFDKNTGKVICTKPGVEVIDNGIKVYRLKPFFPHSIDKHIHFFKGFKHILNSINADLIFVHSVSSPNYRYLFKYKKCHPNVEIVFDNHADWNNSKSNFFSRIYSRYFVRWLIVRKIVNSSNYFYGVVPARCDFLNKMYGVPQEKIYLLPMGADDEEMHIDQKGEIRNEIRKLYGINENDFLIVTGGKIDPKKNIHVLAKAVSNSKYKNIKMIIFGSVRDDLKETFEQLESERIHCIGWQPSNEVYRYFYAADIVMFPGLHSVLWEQAVASRVPCAFSRIKGFEHVDIGGNCVFMDGKTVDYYQALIERLFKDKVYYSQLYNNAQQEQTKQFLYSNIAQKVIDDISV